ncbi:MAG: altronate hydrolase [Bacteroidetes bacterium GWF2_42_66]|nr:MAG: altronate hydrolase [Bacteroidetes bacterium GWA2_42_15]OFY01526.1 MAG: altronate hydrolase [Bacteroidetes bacterium GWE2_42_39]OFY43293.1 MAG: altronate hydrolase [Bacteroidetes bacterium GWF2_42_66]HBL77524.1 altronate hydrolase [Prolixibacteraceae bacterium]HCR90687.1 altronate hydrolase [Prolixibacteraceae bacterium]
MAKFIKINPNDNVAVCIEAGTKGEAVTINNQHLVLTDDISVGYKLALRVIEVNTNVIKYGAPIGHATQTIQPGETVHVHNLKTNLSSTIEYSFQQKQNELNIEKQDLTFNGYVRSNGKTGIRNELWIVPTVGCVNGQAQQIIDIFKRESNPLESIDAVEVFKHNYGCSQLGDDHVNTQKALAALINHPNAGGVLMLGLGCENNQISQMKAIIGEYDTARVKFLAAQDVEDEIEEGVKLLNEIFQEMKNDRRQPVPGSELNVGLKCGGSDGFSGITANPLVGAFSDFLVAQGGTTILTEVPEMFGAETLLMERAKDRTVFDKTVNLINDFKEYYLQHNLPVYENPSPGNKSGGISTLDDKSLGCTQKGGTATVVDVLKYAEPIKTKGLNLLSSPGNDLIASSALGFSGCQLILFTTGRGTPFGSFVPTMKISTNTALSEKKSNWIDFNAGSLLTGKTMEQLLEEFIQFIIEVANGKKLKHEESGFKEISIFKTGVTL